MDSRFYTYLGPFSLLELLDGMDVGIPEGQFCDIVIENAAPVDQAGACDISFVDGKGAARKAAACKAAVCLVAEKMAEHISNAGGLPIISQYPQAEFSAVLARLYQPFGYGTGDNNTFKNVDIGRGVVIGL